MKDHSILENKAESARTNCPSCTNPARYSCSELSSLFLFSATCFLGFRTTVRPAALVSTFLLQQSLAPGLASDALSPPGSGSAEGLWLSRWRTSGVIWSVTALVGDQMTSDTVLCLCGFLNDLLEVYTTESLLKEV